MLCLEFFVPSIVAVLTASIPPALTAAEGSEAGAEAPSDRPPLETLLKLNERAIFGGTFTSQGDDRFEVLFNASGQMMKGFETQGPEIIDDKSPLGVGGNRRFFTKKEKDKEIILAGFAALGLGPPAAKPGVWTSRFPVGGAVKVSFTFRIPNLLTRQSVFNVRLNVDKSNYLESSFFTKVSKMSYGKNLGFATSLIKQYKRPPSDWFPRNEAEGVPVELTVEDQKFTVRMKNAEVVSLDKGTDMTKGKVAFAFTRVAFTIQNLKISGSLDRAWCEKEIEALEKAGKLLLKPPEGKKEEPAIGEDAGATGEGEKKEGEKAKKEGDL
jgi:hypothetical protein